jgi:hypothetical protein
MLIEIKRNSHIKIRERNRLLTYMCMHGPNFNEMLETKENIRPNFNYGSVYDYGPRLSCLITLKAKLIRRV